jgi:hypothetical protein
MKIHLGYGVKMTIKTTFIKNIFAAIYYLIDKYTEDFVVDCR